MTIANKFARRLCTLYAAFGLMLGTAHAQTVIYYHTDALGSPVATTNAAGAVIERSEYEPYGQLLNRPLTDGPGYTGHVSDAQTGLSYMQQRYYDPQIGRFLSMDPVTADASTGGNFNRYWYANNNPYRYTDPDGRNPLGILIGMSVEIGWQMGVEGKSWSEVDKSDVLVAGLIGAVAPGAGSTLLRAGRATPQVVRGVKAITKLAEQSARTANRAAKIETRIGNNVEKIAKGVEGVAATAGFATTGVVVKNLVQETVNQQQSQGQTRKPEPPPPPPPPPPPEKLRDPSRN